MTATRVNSSPADKAKIHFRLGLALELLDFFSVRVTPSIWALMALYFPRLSLVIW